MDEKVRKKPGRYKRMAERGRAVGGCYCIALPANEENCMDIYFSGEFWFRYYRERDIRVIGLAAGRDGVEDILCRMVRDIMERYGEVNAGSVSAYFAPGWKV